MKVIELRQPGPDFDLIEADHPIPTLGDNQVLIQIEYVALNHLDSRLAKQGFHQWSYPHVLGLDAVGTIVEAPKGVFPPTGTRVLFHASLAEHGMLKQYAVLPNHSVVEIPDAVPSDIAAVLPNAGMAALLALQKLQIQSGDSLAINSAQGAVAHFAIQYAKQQGAQVFAFAQKHHHKRLLKLGADFAFDCEDSNVCDAVKRELGSNEFDCILNTQGGESFIQDLEHLRFCGRIACLNGFTTIPEELLFTKAPNIGVVSVGGAWLANSLCAQQHLCFLGQQLLDDIAAGHIEAPKPQLFEFTPQAVKEVLQTLSTRTCEQRPVIKIEEG